MEDSSIFLPLRLELGTVYARAELRRLFSIKDATLNNGHFLLKGHSVVWLFLTEKKSADREQYLDRLDGEDLYTDGQTMRRTDSLIIEHRARGLELLVFYRKNKREFPGAGFRYLGPFEYVSHTAPLSGPTHFHLRRVARAAAAGAGR